MKMKWINHDANFNTQKHSASTKMSDHFVLMLRKKRTFENKTWQKNGKFQLPNCENWSILSTVNNYLIGQGEFSKNK